jgi:prepilin-type N-terminal cleavage/methylation domain-containing protein
MGRTSGGSRSSRPRAGRLRARDDAGVTLIEVVVGMSIMSIVMAVFTVGILQTYRSVNKSTSLSTAQSQINIAFLRLDKEIRYATSISQSGQSGGDWYVEYLIKDRTGTATCTELRLDSAGQLTRRTWPDGSTPRPWKDWPPLVSDIGTVGRDAEDAPFSFPPSDAVNDKAAFQRLRVRLEARSGAGDTATSTQTDVTFTALNAPLSSDPDTTVCIDARAKP